MWEMSAGSREHEADVCVYVRTRVTLFLWRWPCVFARACANEKLNSATAEGGGLPVRVVARVRAPVTQLAKDPTQ